MDPIKQAGYHLGCAVRHSAKMFEALVHSWLMQYLLLLALACSLLLLAGCGTSFGRIFQAKVPAPLGKASEQIEAERRAADLIARKIETPPELKPVAAGLAASLGAPEKPIAAVTPADLPRAADAATEDLQKGMREMQQQIIQLNRNLVKFQGKEIEGTGFSILGPGMATLVIALIVLAVACPPVLTLLAFAYRRLKATASIVVNEMEAASQAPETQAAVQAIKQKVREKMGAHPINTSALKNVILDLKKST